MLRHVPAGVSYVGRGDVSRTLNDAAVTQFTNAILGRFADNEYYSGPTSKTGLLNTFSNATGLEASGASTVVGFGKYGGGSTATSGPYYGFYIEAEWSTDAVVSALESGNFAFTESEYSGQTLYEAGRQYQQLWLGVTNEGSYVLVTEAAVKDTLDVAAGNADSVGSDMRSAFGAIRDAPFKFAAGVPASRLPSQEIDIGGSTIDPQRFASVSYVAGATYHEGNTAGLTSSRA
ncbi:MAG: hypothetical protein ABEJ88_06320 [Halobacterium sp.]